MKDWEKTPVFRPFIYTEDGALYKSHEFKVKIPHNQIAILSCENNFFKLYPNLHNITVKCDDDTIVVDHDKSKHRFKDLNCDLRAIEEIKHTVVGCSPVKGRQGSYIHYFDSKNSVYNILAEVCYNYEDEQSNFVRTQLPYNIEPRIQHHEDIKSSVDIPHKIHMLSAYRTTNAVVKNLLTEEFDFAQNSVVAVKLLPKMFFSQQLYEIEKFETNFVGAWTTVADGNWNRLITDIHEYTKDKKKPFEVIVGTHGTLKLSTPSGEEKIIYLQGDKVPLPHYLWAVVHNKEKSKAVAIVTINNPFIGLEDVKKQMFCDNVCEKITWLSSILKNKNYDRPIYGYTFCCSLESFKIYPLLESTTLLKD